MPVHVCGPKTKAPKNALVVNTTSRSTEEWSKELSPFFLGPVNLYGGHVSKNVENAWQFSKVYPAMIEEDGSIGESYFRWAKSGWASEQAFRYPMGKGSKPSFSYWDGKRMTYIEARKNIYVPLYKEAVKKTAAFSKLQELIKTEDVWLWDFDGYDKDALGMSFDDVINSETKKMGHAFVIAMLLEGKLI